MNESIAISLVLFLDLAIFIAKVSATKGGLSLLRSSVVQNTCFGMATSTSCLHQVFICFFSTFTGSVMVSQHGPLIFYLRRNSSRILWLVPNTAENVFPLRLAGSGGQVAGYLTFRNVCSPCARGNSNA